MSEKEAWLLTAGGSDSLSPLSRHEPSHRCAVWGPCRTALREMQISWEPRHGTNHAGGTGALRTGQVEGLG